MTGPPSASKGPPKRDVLRALAIAMIVAAVLISGYGLVSLYGLNRSDFYTALVGAAVGLPLGMWPILQYLFKKPAV